MLACSIVSLTPLVAFSGTLYGSRPNNFLASLPTMSSGVALPLKFVSPSPPGKSLGIHIQRSTREGFFPFHRDLRRRQALAEINDLSAKIPRTVEREESVSHSSVTSTTLHFLTVNGTAGIYSTDESPAPVCSLSTACTKSQCPTKRDE